MPKNLFKKLFRSLFEGFLLWRKCNNNHLKLIEILRVRVIFSCICNIMIFGFISYKIANIMVISKYNISSNKLYDRDEIIKKADIVDRNGELLATSISTASCFIDPSVVIDIEETSQKLSKIKGMPNAEKIKKKILDKNKHFVWISRHITPKIQEEILDLGLPGVQFQKDFKRIYIHGSLFSHIIGCSDIDGNGICGIEKQFNDQLTIKKFTNKKLILSVDLRLQSIIHEELNESIKKFKADGGNAILMSTNGDILSMVSLPDFDPNNLKNSNSSAMFNRNTLGAFEQGSILKILNVATALDSGSAKLNSIYDASSPIKIGRFTITDFKGKNRNLSLAEAFVFSSNIASIKIAQSFGIKTQKEYMKKFGMLDKIKLEIPEMGSPIVPLNWSDVTCMTISYGYGLAITPLQLLNAVSSIVNDGIKIDPTLLYGRSSNNNQNEKIRLVSSDTSKNVRDLMRAVICFGTGKKAGVDGVSIFGKTGTAYKLSGKGYGTSANRTRITTFVGGFPKDKPKYMLIVMLDNPKPIEGTFGYATSGWNVAPTARNIFERITPILYDKSEGEESDLKVVKYIKLD